MGTHLIIYDSTDFMLFPIRPHYIKENDEIVYVDAKGKNLEQIKQEVKQKVNSRTIKSFYISSHGSYVYQLIGNNLLTSETVEGSNLSDFIESLDLKFENNGFVMLGGCYVGSSKDLISEVRDKINIDTYAVDGRFRETRLGGVRDNYPWDNNVIAKKEGGLCASKASIPFSKKDCQSISLPSIFEIYKSKQQKEAELNQFILSP